MLVKKELLTIPTLPKPQIKQEKYTSHRGLAAAQVADLPKSGHILAVDYYMGDNLYSRFFCDGANYTVWLPAKDQWTKERWSSCYPGPGCHSYSWDGSARTNETDKIISAFFGPDKSTHGLESISAFVYDKNYEKARRTADNKYALMLEHFKMFPPLPDNFQEYCENHIFPMQYIFMDKVGKDGTRKARCGHCGAEFTVGKGVRSGQTTVCPECGRKATFKGSWFQSEIRDRKEICIANRVNGQLLLRWVRVDRSYSFPAYKARYSADDVAYSLYLIEKDKPKLYSYKYFCTFGCYGEDWHRLDTRDNEIYNSSYVYTDNLNDVFGDRYYNVNLKAGLEKKDVEVRFVRMLDALKHQPKAEYLFKLGLPRLVEFAGAIIGDPQGQGTFQRELGISKQFLPILRDYQVDLGEFRAIRASKEWVTPEILQKYRALKLQCIDSLDEIAGELGFSKTVNYMDKQRAAHPKVGISKLGAEYADYLRMSRELGVYMGHKSVKFPPDIVEAHKQLVGRYNAVKAEINKKKLADLDQTFQTKATQIYEDLGLGEFHKNGFCVVLPQLRTDLITEGQSLNHCVGGDHYYMNHLRGIQMIFFIRKESKPEEPFFTMELNVQTGKIMQLYGFGDCSAPKDVRAFAESFAAHTQRKKERLTA